MCSHGCSTQKPKPKVAESTNLYPAQRPEESIPADSIPQSPHPSGLQSADPSPSGYRPARAYPRPEPSGTPLLTH
ncbi:hypothetical protein Tco_0718462, partial [Tanacetum coccineum]